MSEYPKSPEEVAILMESTEDPDLELFILEYWESRTVNEDITDFTRKPLLRGLWNVTKGTVRTIAGTLWNALMTPMGLLGPGPAKFVWEDAGVALRHTIKGIAETLYGLAQTGYGAVKAIKDYASIAANDIRQEINKWVGDDSVAQQAADAVKGEIEGFSSEMATRAA